MNEPDPSSSKPLLSLPPRDEWSAPARQASRAIERALLVLCLAVAGGSLALQFRRTGAPAGAPTAPPAATQGALPASELREVAVRLQRDNLHSAAAAAYEEYLSSADLKPEERGNILFEIGNLLARAGRHEDALARYFRAQKLVDQGQESALQLKVQECLQRLGKHAERGYELRDQLGPQPGASGQGEKSASEVLAWIGPEKITTSVLDDLIAQEIEEQAAAVPGLAAEKVVELKERARKQLSAPQARLQKLQEHLARTVLYREGLETGADRSPRVQRRLGDLSRDLIVEEMVHRTLEDRVRIGESDLRTYHRAHPERFREPASAKVRIALVADEAKAREVIAGVKSEADFERIAREQSIDAGSKEKGGLLDAPLRAGEPIPGIGLVPLVVEKALAAAAPGLIHDPVAVEKGFLALFVLEKRDERAIPFEEARERVGRELAREKTAEVQSQMVQELFKKHAVSVATEAFLPQLKGAATEAANAKPPDPPVPAPPPPPSEK